MEKTFKVGWKDEMRRDGLLCLFSTDRVHANDTRALRQEDSKLLEKRDETGRNYKISTVGGFLQRERESTNQKER